jgi:hypothetical protein
LPFSTPKIKTPAIFLTINNTIFRTIFRSDCDGLAGKIKVFVAIALIGAVSNQNRIAVNGGINAGLNRRIFGSRDIGSFLSSWHTSFSLNQKAKPPFKGNSAI